MNRLLFAKEGDGIFISHLDLMRLFQRAFRRAGVAIRHTNGFSPHDYVAIALPLSVGTASRCEILEFTLEGEAADLAALPEQLNRTLPRGVRVLEAYESSRALKELSYLHVVVQLEYDAGVPKGAQVALEALFAQPSLLVEKRTKKGPADVDIRPLIHSLAVLPGEEPGVLLLDAVVRAQNPALNPDLLRAAIDRHLPSCSPDFSKSTRLEILDESFAPFR